jgi:hypothetical protein
MGGQIENALATTWANVFNLWASFFQLFIMIGFSWYLIASNADFIGCSKREKAAATDGKTACDLGVYRFLTFIPILFIAIPVIMIVFDGVMLKLNIRRSTELNIHAMEKADDWSTFVVEAGDLKSLVQTYRQDYQVAMEFKGLHKAFNGANFKANMFEQGTLWKAKWFPTLLAAAVMILLRVRPDHHRPPRAARHGQRRDLPHVEDGERQRGRRELRVADRCDHV